MKIDRFLKNIKIWNIGSMKYTMTWMANFVVKISYQPQNPKTPKPHWLWNKEAINRERQITIKVKNSLCLLDLELGWFLPRHLLPLLCVVDPPLRFNCAWGVKISIEAGLVGLLHFQIEGNLDIAVSDLDDTIVRGKTQAALVAREGAQRDALEEGEFLH